MTNDIIDKMVAMVVEHNGNGGKEAIYRKVDAGEITEETAAVVLLRAHLYLLSKKVEMLSELTA